MDNPEQAPKVMPMPKYKIQYDSREIVLDGVQFQVRDGFHVFVDDQGEEVCRIATDCIRAIWNQNHVTLDRPVPSAPIKVIRAGDRG